ncbi:regulator of G-protein signaling 16 [Brachyhypopomus gauderio]|uniref:regulator of G-protein signaling 16 n=1 Tax=Brachyhypopomus gauderio TaxID=698409 RepID=UPI004041B2D8
MCRRLAVLPNACLERAKGLKESVGSFLQKQDWRLHSCTNKLRKPRYRLTLEECLRWKESFEKLLSSKYGLYTFRAFLVSEFSEENIAFYLACEDYRNTECIAKLPAKAQSIYNEFIGSEAPREVNIDHETRDITQVNVNSPTPKCFDLAQYRIYILMEKDCYPRFLRSTTYRDLLSQLTKESCKAGR